MYANKKKIIKIYKIYNVISISIVMMAIFIKKFFKKIIRNEVKK